MHGGSRHPSTQPRCSNTPTDTAIQHIALQIQQQTVRCEARLVTSVQTSPHPHEKSI